MAHSKVIIIDYGSQVTQLIARRVREAGVYSEIHACNVTAAEVAAMAPSAIILSGGPASVGEADAPTLDKGFLELGVPVLGICYGMQLLAQNLGGELAQSLTREYGPADLTLKASCALWDGLDSSKASRVWMSHGDKVKTPPPGFVITGSTPPLEVAAMADESRKIYAVQFHPEVHHSVDGDAMLRNFLFKVCNIVPDWSMSSFVERVVKKWPKRSATSTWSAPPFRRYRLHRGGRAAAQGHRPSPALHLRGQRSAAPQRRRGSGQLPA